MKIDHEKSEVTISIEDYRKLLYSNATLTLLEAGGVDNWTWYGESLYPDSGEQNIEDLQADIDELLKKD